MLFLLLTCPALAGTYKDVDGVYWTLVDPPAHWLDQPLPSDTRVFKLPRDLAFRSCELAGAPPNQHGCAEVIVGLDACYVWVVDDLPVPFMEAVINHELAHCRGWPQSHPTDQPSYAEQREKLKAALFPQDYQPKAMPLSGPTLDIIDKYFLAN